MLKTAEVDNISAFEIWNNFRFKTNGAYIAPEQKKQVSALIKRECCNYDAGNCVLLDDGFEHKCPQCSTDTLGCPWFLEALLPLNPTLEAELMEGTPLKMKKCAVCGKEAIPSTSHAKYCAKCAVKIHREQKTRSQRKYRMRVDN